MGMSIRDSNDDVTDSGPPRGRGEQHQRGTVVSSIRVPLRVSAGEYRDVSRRPDGRQREGRP